MEIKGKFALVTGGASGMGAATAKQLAAAGANVAVLDLNKEHADKMAKEISGIAVECDVADTRSVEAAVEQVVAAFSAIHIVVNCAGIAPAARIVGREGPMWMGDFERVLRTNLCGTFNMMRLVADQMIRQEPVNEDNERGVIINTSSIAATEGQLGQAAYSASKGGIEGLMLPAAREFAQFGIRVMTIAPGVVETPMMEAMPENVHERLVSSVTFPQRLAQPEEFSELAQHIVENAYLNANTIRLDGGLRMATR